MKTLKISSILKTIFILAGFLLFSSKASALLQIDNNSKYTLKFSCPDCTNKNFTLRSGETIKLAAGGSITAFSKVINVYTSDKSMPFPYNKPNFNLGSIAWNGGPVHGKTIYCATANYSLATMLKGTTQPGDGAGPANDVEKCKLGNDSGYAYHKGSNSDKQAAVRVVLTDAS